jgi:hypothetical protein
VVKRPTINAEIPPKCPYINEQFAVGNGVRIFPSQSKDDSPQSGVGESALSTTDDRSKSFFESAICSTSTDSPHPPQTYLWLLSCLVIFSKPPRINGEVYGELYGRGGSDVGSEQLARDRRSRQPNQVLTSVGNSLEIKEQISILQRPLG